MVTMPLGKKYCDNHDIIDIMKQNRCPLQQATFIHSGIALFIIMFVFYTN